MSLLKQNKMQELLSCRGDGGEEDAICVDGILVNTIPGREYLGFEFFWIIYYI